jgi:hypothetical protein
MLLVNEALTPVYLVVWPPAVIVVAGPNTSVPVPLELKAMIPESVAVKWPVPIPGALWLIVISKVSVPVQVSGTGQLNPKVPRGPTNGVIGTLPLAPANVMGTEPETDPIVV